MYMPAWVEIVFAVAVFAVLIMLAVFLAACTLRVLSGGNAPVVEGPKRRRARKEEAEKEQEAESEARVGEINLG